MGIGKQRKAGAYNVSMLQKGKNDSQLSVHEVQYDSFNIEMSHFCMVASPTIAHSSTEYN